MVIKGIKNNATDLDV